MGHGKLDHETALGLKELRCRLEEDGNRAPPSILDETMKLATSSLVAAQLTICSASRPGGNRRAPGSHGGCLAKATTARPR